MASPDLASHLEHAQSSAGLAPAARALHAESGSAGLVPAARALQFLAVQQHAGLAPAPHAPVMWAGAGQRFLLLVCGIAALFGALLIGVPSWMPVVDEAVDAACSAGRVGGPVGAPTGQAGHAQHAADLVGSPAGAPTGQAAEVGLTGSASRVGWRAQVVGEPGSACGKLSGQGAGEMQASSHGVTVGAWAAAGEPPEPALPPPWPAASNRHAAPGPLVGTGDGELSSEASSAAGLEAFVDHAIEQDIAQLEALVELLARAADHCHGLHSSQRKRRRACQRVSRVGAVVDAALHVVYADGALNLSSQKVAALAVEAAQAARRVELAGRTAGT